MKRKQRHTTAYRDESRFFYIAISIFVVVLLTYMYFVSAAVAHVVVRKEVDGEIREKKTELSILESEYIDIQHAMSADVAEEKGFHMANSKVFIDTGEETLVLRTN